MPLSWRVLARRPSTFVARAIADAVHARADRVPAELTALATLRAASLVDCPFCIDILSAEASRSGVRNAQVERLDGWRESEAFSADERLVLVLAEAMTATPAAVPADLRTRVIERFGEVGLVELASAIGHENARARSGRALGLPAQGFSATG